MSAWVTALRVTGLGWFVVVSLLGGVAAGRGLDKWLGSYPSITIAGVVLGAIVASLGVYRMVAPMLEQSHLNTGKINKDKER